MKLTRTTGLAAVMTAGVLALAACGGSSGGSSSSAGTSGGGGAIDCATGSIKASGSSAQKNAITEWINAYQQECTGATINYQANGSGAGIQDFINKQTSFAGSDSALKDADRTKADARCAAGPAIDIPMVGGAIAAAYNLAGVDKLVLTPQVIAGIFSQQDHQVERPGHHRAQLGCLAARRHHRSVPPQRLLGHHGQLHQAT